MDYNDNDFESQDFHLDSEDSSKDSSVLRPYPLPKFDFDDSLHGHLRFDSLVENEAFLGITSHEDNRWIEDFSQPGNGIEFSSGAPESCSLPSRINVWSEATSSESVEMLLKAVVQEEIDPGESLMQESNTLNEQGSTEEMDNRLMKDDVNIDSNCGNSSLPSIKVEENVSRSIHDTGVVGIPAEDTFGTQVMERSSCEVLVGAEEGNLVALTEGSTFGMLNTDRDLVETCPSENESASNPVNENFPIQGKWIDTIEFPSQEISNIKESAVKDENADRIMGVEIDNTERDCSVRFSSGEEFGVEMPDSVYGEASSNDDKGVSVVETEMSKYVVIDTQNGDNSTYETVVLSSSIEVNQVSEHPSVSYENPISIAGQGRDGVEIKSSISGSITVCGETELIQAPVVELSDEEKSCVADGNILHASNISLEAQHSSLMPSELCEVVTFPIKVDDKKDTNEDEDQIKSKDPTIIDGFSGEKSMLGAEQDLSNINAVEESGMRHDHDCNPLVDSITQSSTDNTLNLSDDVGDRSLTSSAEAVEMLDTTGANLQSSETENADPGGGTLPQASKRIGTSVAMDCSNLDETNSYLGFGKLPAHDSVAVEMMKSDEANSFSENSSRPVPSEPSGEVTEKMEPSGSNSEALHKFADAEDEEKLEEVERNDKEINFSVGHSWMEQNKTFETTATDPVCDDIALVEVDKHDSILRSNIEIDEALVNSEPSEVDIPAEEKRECNTNDRHVVPQSSRDLGKEASGSNKADDSTPNIVPNVNSTTAGLGSSSEDLRTPSNRKSRRGGSKSTRGGAKRANPMKETTPVKASEIMEKPSNFVSPLGSGQLLNFDGSIKHRGPFPIPASGLPDLNTSAPSSAFFRQPFTDLQQVQLRAQIIVYGSLIQGEAPDEACMISAFDGDRNPWERSWRVCVDRLQVGKLKGNIVEAFVPARLDAKAPDHLRRQGFSEGEVLSSVTAHARKKGAVSPIVNPMIPLSSPLWTMSTIPGDSHPPISTAKGAVDYQIVSSLNHYQTPPVRKYAAQSGWSTLAPLPWLASTQSSPFDFSANHPPAFPITTPLKLSPVPDSSLPAGMSSKHLTPIHTTQPGVLTDVLPAPSVELKNLKVLSDPNSETTRRKKKKKKSSDHEDLPSVSGTTSVIDASLNTVVSNYSSKKVLGVENSVQISFIPQARGEPMQTAAIGGLYSTTVTVATPTMNMPKTSTNPFFSLNPPSVSADTLKRVDISLQSRALNAESSKKAEEAMLQAQEAEASAASAIAYCESVWSKLDLERTSLFELDTVSKLASAAAAIAAAASVAKAAAAAAKIAENVAAHEKQMLEEALLISQTAKTTAYDGSLVSSTPSSLTNASPASIFNGLKHSTSGIAAAREAARKRIEAASVATRHAENLDAIVKAAEMAAEAVSHAGKIVAMTNPLSLSKLVEAGPSNYWKDPLPVSKPNDKRSDLLFHGDSGAVLDVFRSQQEGPDALGVSGIREGSRVEVLRDYGDSKKAWFSATVLGFREGEVLVSYTDVLSEEGSEQLKEWVSMGAKDNNAPRVRIPHPLSFVPHERTKKRPRDAGKDYNWSVGDRVDAWMKNCWCEGIISEKSKKDESALCVKFPDQEETALVKVWHLRPSLTWNGVQWIKVPKSGSNDTCKGDTPAQKRPKIVSMASEPTEKGKQIGESDPAEIQRTEGPNLPLSSDEKKFRIGEGNKSKAIRGMRSGFEKEKSRVVFGVPKPGKKRKFMEVSKHYVSEPRVKDSVRLPKLLAPHGQSSKTGSKVEVKEKQAFEGKTRSARSAKLSSNRILPKKDDSTSLKPEEGNDSVSEHATKGSASGTESELGEQNFAEHGSTSNQEENSRDANAMVFSSKALPQSKKVPRNAAPERPARRNAPIPSGRSLKQESSETQILDAAEPRRSVRRIQPTSRLLEGLQSSLIISKLPSASHDKGLSKATTAKGNTNRGG